MIVAAVTPAIRASRVQVADGEAARFLALGYQQTDEPAVRGGKPNANGFRFRRGAMRNIARSFRGNPFITGHNWGDVRARGGTITDAYAEELEAAQDPSMAMYFEIKATSEWALEGLDNGNVDRFSIGASGVGEIMCTVHQTPVWAECWCWPGAIVDVFDKDGNKSEVIAEWEYQDALGLELSAVNVAAVDGTYVVEIDEGEEGSEDMKAAAGKLALLCGRSRPRMPRRPAVQAGLDLRGEGAPAPTAAPAPVAPSMGHMNHEELCRKFGLPITATPAELEAKIALATQALAQVPVLTEQLRANAPDRAEHERELTAARARADALDERLLAQHVDAEIGRLRRERQVRDPVVATLRATAASNPDAATPATARRAAFDANLKLVEDSAPVAAPPAGGPRAALQSDTAPIARGTDGSGSSDGAPDAPDAYEQHKNNPELARMMRVCKLSVDDVRKHGPKAITVIPDLDKLVANSPS